MHTSFEQRVTYERLKNGMDVYLLRGSAADVVIAEFAFPGGEYATYEVPVITSLLELMLPGSTKTYSRTALLDSVGRLGAQVSVHTDDTHLIVSVSSRRAVFPEVLRIVVEVLMRSTLPIREYTEAVSHLRSSLSQARENTRVRAQERLLQTLYRKGHPHWSPDISALYAMLAKVTRNDLVAFHKKTFTSVGGVACVVGDIDIEATLVLMRDACAAFPMQAPFEVPRLHVDHLRNPSEVPVDSIISLKDKSNVDTYLGIPTTLTRESAAYHALQVGVYILGGSSATSRLFTALRTKQSLTYGAYASLQGLSDGYPGYLSAKAIFPHDVFGRARSSFREVIRLFVEKGITSKELMKRKEEIRGKHVIGLSTTSGLCATLFGTVLSGRSVTYLDEYLARIDALTVREVNTAISEYLPYDRAVTVAAGAIDQSGPCVTDRG